MGRSARTSTALIDGCCVCGGTRPGMLVLRATGEMMCRPCAARLGALFAEASHQFLSWLCRQDESAQPPPVLATRAPPELLYAEIHAARVEHQKEAGPAATLGANDVQAHCDLSMAYREMGLGADALREAAFALGGDVDHTMADGMFNVMFDPEHARPDALVVVARWMRSQRR